MSALLCVRAPTRRPVRAAAGTPEPQRLDPHAAAYIIARLAAGGTHAGPPRRLAYADAKRGTSRRFGYVLGARALHERQVDWPDAPLPRRASRPVSMPDLLDVGPRPLSLLQRVAHASVPDTANYLPTPRNCITMRFKGKLGPDPRQRTRGAAAQTAPP